MRVLRALAYLTTGVVLGLVTLVCLPVVAVATVLVGLPAAAIPLAALERRRLALLAVPVPPSPHRPDRRLRQRYAELATWRELAYALLFASVLPLTGALVLALVGLLGFWAVIHPVVTGQGWLAALGLLVPLLLALGLARLLATGQAALVRGLLGGETEQTIRELTRSRGRLVDAYEIERRRIERDLHDGAQQRLVTLAMTLGLARLALDEGRPARDLVDRASGEADAALDDLRRLVRGIHPRVLTDHGLAAAVAELADRSAVPVTVALDLPERAPSTVESTAYFVIAEALTNAAKHARATAVTVTGAIAGRRLRVAIGDDGVGGAEPDAGGGLTGLADRVAALDGTLTLSSPPGGPTVLRVDLPCSVS